MFERYVFAKRSETASQTTKRYQIPAAPTCTKGAITSKLKLKHAIKLEASPSRLVHVQLLQPSLAFCFSLQPMTAYRPGLDGCATVVQVLQNLFYVLLQVLFYL